MIIANGTETILEIGPKERAVARAAVQRHAQSEEELGVLLEMLALVDDRVDA